MALRKLATAMDLLAARAHPYLVSLCKIGLMEQVPDTSHYRLHSLAIEAGLISLPHVAPYRLARNTMRPDLPGKPRCTRSLAA